MLQPIGLEPKFDDPSLIVCPQLLEKPTITGKATVGRYNAIIRAFLSAKALKPDLNRHLFDCS